MNEKAFTRKIKRLIMNTKMTVLAVSLFCLDSNNYTPITDPARIGEHGRGAE